MGQEEFFGMSRLSVSAESICFDLTLTLHLDFQVFCFIWNTAVNLKWAPDFDTLLQSTKMQNVFIDNFYKVK